MQPSSTWRGTPVRPRGSGTDCPFLCCTLLRPIVSRPATKGTKPSSRARSSGGRAIRHRFPAIAPLRVALRPKMMPCWMSICLTSAAIASTVMSRSSRPTTRQPRGAPGIHRLGTQEPGDAVGPAAG
ncbi:unnamed protein product [Macrosiphum euphorbiae]|uniref:Uncharacterized protein n=1 Tax=Macrosiphum euphorbiae TaxID=13131 RepID=A0AAV0XRX1_9HEMI|nr:unnamed protein product [Macrosiphum euphorbiae]